MARTKEEMAELRAMKKQAKKVEPEIVTFSPTPPPAEEKVETEKISAIEEKVPPINKEEKVTDLIIVQLPGGKCELRRVTPLGYKVITTGSREKCEVKMKCLS